MSQLLSIKQGDSDTLCETITGLSSLDCAGTEVDTLDGTIDGLVITYQIFNESSKAYPIGIHEFETKIFDDIDHVYTPTEGKFIVDPVIEEDPE